MKVKSFIQCWRYEILLGSFLLLIFGNTFFPDYHRVGPWLVTINMLTGLLVFFDHKRWWRLSAGLMFLRLLLLTGFSRYENIGNFALRHFIYQLYFWMIAVLVFRKILTVKEVSREMIAAVICGFIILCQMAAYTFLQIELFHAHSFSNLPGGNQNIDQLTYFSFQTLLTAGYGDIIPLTLVAKHAVMFMGLIGHFYTVIVTSIIIGKYLNTNKPATNPTGYRFAERASTEARVTGAAPGIGEHGLDVHHAHRDLHRS